MTSFTQLGITDILSTVLKKQGLRTPTEVQAASIPHIFKGEDIITQSQTGTGKTLAYLLPLMQRIRPDISQEQALIVTPTRELARQIFDVLRPFASALGIDAADIIGGRTIENQLQKLKRSPHIIIGTPGRLLDHMHRNSLNLTGVRQIVLDEADQMLAAGFREDIEQLIDKAPKGRQLLLFSATMPEDVRKLARKYMQHPFTVHLKEKVTASSVEQRVYETSARGKFALLVRHLHEMNPYLALVFCNTKEETSELADRLSRETDLAVDELQGNMSQSQRNNVIRNFEKAKLQVLVASDLAARGLDIRGVTHVFNYGIPANTEYYIHRIGRTGRAGESGLSITYATPEDALLLRRLEKSIHETITRYDEKGNVKKIRKATPRKKSVTPGMYKPTKEKAHKALGHKGRDMRRKVKVAEKPKLKKLHNPRKRPRKVK